MARFLSGRNADDVAAMKKITIMEMLRLIFVFFAACCLFVACVLAFIVFLVLGIPFLRGLLGW